MIELERTFLVKKLPDGLEDCRSKEIIDIYMPASEDHPKLRLRKNGGIFEITKKHPIADDPSEQIEHTIDLTEEEYLALSATSGKKVRKIRYQFPFGLNIAEIDVFQDTLLGLVIADFEFKSVEEKDSFAIPDFCSVDITDEEFIAGGMICGKSYGDIEEDLRRFGYEKVMIR